MCAADARSVFDGRERRSVYDKKPVNVTLKRTEPHLIVRSDKSEAEVIIIKDCAVDGHKTSSGLSATAGLLVLSHRQCVTLIATQST